MRLVLAMVVAGLVALPLSATAQVGEEEGSRLERWQPEAFEDPDKPAPEPAPEEPALQLKLDDAGVEVTQSPPRTFLGYTLEELELRKRRAAFGLIAPAALIGAGVPLLVRGTTSDCAYDPSEPYSDRCGRFYDSGMALTISGGVGMIYALSLLGVRKRELERPYTPDRYTLEVRVKRARRGLISTFIIFGVGVGLLVGGAVQSARNPPPPDESFDLPDGFFIAGVTLVSAGSLGMLISATVLGVGKRRLRRLREAHYGTPRRVQWDLARSRLVF